MIINKNKIQHAYENLINGNLIIYPTDTLYGLGADATNDEAINTINKLKNRNTPLSIMVESIDKLSKYGIFDNKDLNVFKSLFPGAFTILLKSKNKNISPLVQNKSKKIGIRIPNNLFCLKLLKKFKKPIITTSVNIHGESAMNDINEINKMFCNIDIYKDRVNKNSKGSTIIDFTENPPKVIRKGDGNFYNENI